MKLLNIFSKGGGAKSERGGENQRVRSIRGGEEKVGEVKIKKDQLEEKRVEYTFKEVE